MSKLGDFLNRNGDNLREDAGERPEGAGEIKPSKMEGRTRLSNVVSLTLDRIEADPQARESFDTEALQRLAESMKQHGQLQPIRVRWNESRGKYIIIAGERRYRAAGLAELTTIDCVVAEGELSNAQILNEQVIENALREDLLPGERAKAFRQVMEINGWDGKQLAEQLQIAPSTVSRSLALLKLDEEMLAKVDAGEVAATLAIRQVQQDGGGRPGPKLKLSGKGSRGKVLKEWSTRTSVGRLSLTGRKHLSSTDIIAALREALNGLEEMPKAA